MKLEIESGFRVIAVQSRRRSKTLSEVLPQSSSPECIAARVFGVLNVFRILDVFRVLGELKFWSISVVN